MKREQPSNVLICFPNSDIQTSWEKDFDKWGYKPTNVTYTTFLSLKKHVDGDWDFFIVDEIHKASNNQLAEIRKLVDRKVKTLALSGTITQKTEKNIFYKADLALVYDYSIELAVKEGILCDYQIYIHKVPLSKVPNGKYVDKKKKPISESEQFSKLMYRLALTKKSSRTYFMCELQAINLIQNSESKLEKTLELIEKFKDERIMVFCGTTDIADKLGIPVYHSKAREKQMFDDFCSGVGNAIATVKMAQAGITVLPINKGIINYTSGSPEDAAQTICRFLGLEYGTPDKKAELHIVCCNESFERIRMLTALQFFDYEKIKWLE